MPPHAHALIGKLRSVLAGERILALADDPELDYLDAAELKFLLENLSTE